MYDVIDFLQSKGELLTGKAVAKEDIEKIEEQLGVSFANDYKKIVSTYGFVCVDGHEITGITNAKRLNVYEVTIKERERVTCDMSEMYVIEQTHIDDIVIWQSALGEVYQTNGNHESVKIAEGIVDYFYNVRRNRCFQ